MPLRPLPAFRAALALLLLPAAAPAACIWREPPRAYPEGVRWSCVAVGWADGDTFRAECDGHPKALSIQLRGVDTAERGQAGWLEARGELRRRIAGWALDVLPHHRSFRRVVADVPVDGVNVGAAVGRGGVVQGGLPQTVARLGRSK